MLYRVVLLLLKMQSKMFYFELEHISLQYECKHRDTERSQR